MWLHVAVFLLLGAVAVLWRLGWIPREELADKKDRQLFLALGAAGNILGLILTLQSLDVSLGPSPALERRGSDYEEELVVIRDGEDPWAVTIRVPMMEGEETKEPQEEKDEETARREELLEELVLYNEENGSEDYFFLPDAWNGHSYEWQRPRDGTGTLLAALFLVAAAAALVLRRREKEKEGQRRGEALMLDYPEVVMRFTLLIRSGMTVRNVFAKLAEDSQGKDRLRHPVYEEIRSTCYEIEAGISEAEAYRRFGERCGQIKYKTFATLLIQNLQKGSRQLLVMLERETEEAWDERKRRARIQGEEAATRLLFPMILMMVCVLAIIMIPALLSFYGT